MVKDAVVKIDKELLGLIEELILENKYKYASSKQVVNLAVLEFLKSNSLSKLKRISGR